MTTSELDTTMVPVTIEGILSPEPEDGADKPPRYWIKLAETGGDRVMAIEVGPAEAIALAFRLDEQELPRPLTYQFTASLLTAAGGELREVRITRFSDDGVFYAEAALGNGAVVDARPSDAVNLAAVTGAPVLVASGLLRADPASAPEESGKSGES